MQFFPADYLSDTTPLSAATRGIWMDLICFLWRAEPRGSLRYPKETWMRLLRVTQKEFDAALTEFASFSICNVNGNDPVTIESRRIMRYEKSLHDNRIRVARYRSNKESNVSVMKPVIESNGPCHGENQNQSHSQKQNQKQKHNQNQSQNQSKSVLHTPLADRDGKGFTPVSDTLQDILLKRAQDAQT
jgi:uncharacterized protein YdaU (DUF1376 family)